ncbi:MAG TPA: GAF domain-containing protein [Candidatus Acidoferrum sp.]|nr:GAF domain-containing protein [Candidatus Acidoferrum sp.]
MAEYVPTCSVSDARQSVEQAKTMLEYARDMWSRAIDAVVEAQKLREDLHAQIAELAKQGTARPKFLDALLDGILLAAIKGTDADMGIIQVLDPRTQRLAIEVQSGFKSPFLEHFNSEESHQVAGGVALKSRQRVVVPDVTNSPVFSAKESLEIMLDAGVRAVQATPLITKSERLLGIFSTHHRKVNYFSERDLRLIDYFAERATEILEVEFRASQHRSGAIIPIGNSRAQIPLAIGGADD